MMSLGGSPPQVPWWMHSAAVPATRGEAMLVPEMVLYGSISGQLSAAGSYRTTYRLRLDAHPVAFPQLTGLSSGLLGNGGRCIASGLLEVLFELVIGAVWGAGPRAGASAHGSSTPLHRPTARNLNMATP